MAKKPEECEVGAPAWFVTYSDLVTNMLCFFVMLFAFSTLDSPKKRQTSESRDEKFWATFSINNAQGAHQWLNNGGKGILLTPASRKSEMPRIVKKVRNALQKVKMSDRILVLSNDQMVKIRIPSKVLFKPGKAVLASASATILEALMPVVGNSSNDIRIDGHTDDLPPNKKSIYPSNWELSTARACSVVRYFTHTMGLNPNRFAAQGYADTRPQVPNDSVKHREMNRRVEIVILANKRKHRKVFKWE